MCTPQWCYIHFNIDLRFVTPLHHALSVSSLCPSKIWASSVAVKMYRCIVQLAIQNINSKAYLFTHAPPPPLKIIPRTYHALSLQSKVNIEWKRHWQELFLQRIFLLSALFVLPFKEAWKYHFFSSRLLSIPFGKHWFCFPLWFLCSTSKHGSV